MANSISNLLPNKNVVFGMPKNSPTIPLMSMGTANTTKPVSNKINTTTPGIIKPPVKTVANTAGATGGNATSTPIPTNTTPPINNITAGNQQNTPGSTSNIIPTPNPNSYQGLVSRVAGAGTPNNTQTGLIKQLQDAAAGNTQIGADARAIADRYSNEINRVGGLGAGAVAGNLGTGTNVVGAGNAAIASQSASARMNALGQAEQAALQGTGQQLTGQSQMASAYNNALSGANTQQGQNISALGTAAGLASPTTAAYGQTVFNPLTGQYSGGDNNLNPQNVASDLAQKVISGQMTYDQASSSLGYAGNAGQQFLNNAIKGVNPNFNIPQSQATLSGQTGVAGQLPQMQAADTAAEGIRNKIDTYLDNNPGLNASNAAIGNLAQQWLQGKQLADPKYQTLFNYLNEYTSTLAPILGVGGDTTNLKTEIAQSFVNAAASGQSISEVLQNISSLSKGKIQDLRSGSTGGGVVSSPNNSNGTSGRLSWHDLLD